ncbi:MAG TPA: phage baseplate assembly protein V [Edaphobacter sp.]|jgi:uncharacterized protein involved in type VI secretion and phage assembly|nr:phage baseplate assembly protein V [Edaphobacter sp.]
MNSKRIAGAVVGVVKSLKDDSGQGRILLQFPYLPGAPESAMAPVAAPLAGKNRGAFYMPEIEDEVLVCFDQGNINHPYIIGYLWNGVDKPPETDPKNRIFLSPGGNTLRFEDGDNAKKVILQSSSGHKIVLDDTSSADSITLQTRGNLSVTLSDVQNSITLSGGGRMITMSNGTVQIS